MAVDKKTAIFIFSFLFTPVHSQPFLSKREKGTDLSTVSFYVKKQRYA